MSNLSFIPYVGNGVTKEYGISFTGADMGYLRQSDVKVLVDGVQVSSTINPASPHLVILDEAPPVGSQIIVRREMPIDTPYADFSRGNNFGYRQVNNSFLQQLYLTHELLDGFYPDGFYFKQAINFGGYPLKNIGDGVEDTDAVSVGQAASIAEKAVGANFVQEEVPTSGVVQGSRWYKPSVPTVFTYYIDTSGSGQWVEESSVGDDTSSANISRPNGTTVEEAIALSEFKTIAEAKAFDYDGLPEHTRVAWQGRYEQNDGGGNCGELMFGTHIEDGIGVFSVNSEKYIKAELVGKSSVRLSGVHESGSPELNTERLQKAISVLKTPNVTLGEFNVNSIEIPLYSGLTGESNRNSRLNFTSSGIQFIDAFGELRNLMLSGTKQGVELNPSEGVNGNIGITHQATPNSSGARMDNLTIEGFDTAYAEVPTGDIWTGAYRKLSNATLNYNSIGISAVGGSTDLRIVSTDIRNASKHALFAKCTDTAQYSNIRASQVLFENGGITIGGELTGRRFDSGVVVGLNTNFTATDGCYFEQCSVFVDKGGSFTLRDSYKNLGSRLYGLGTITIDGGYIVTTADIGEIQGDWTASGVSISKSTTNDESYGSYIIKSTGDGFTGLDSLFDETIRSRQLIKSGMETFAKVSYDVRVISKPTANWFGAVMSIQFIDTAGKAWRNNIALDADPEMFTSLDSDWVQLSYTSAVRFGGSGLNINEFIRSVRVNATFTDAGYSIVNDGDFEFHIKNLKVELYTPENKTQQ